LLFYYKIDAQCFKEYQVNMLSPRIHRSLVCERNRLSTRVLEQGTGQQPCVMLHGFGDTACVWSDLATAIADRSRSFAIDLRGHGDSDWDPQGQYGIHTLTNDVIRVVRSLGIDQILLAGHSLGAEIALRLAVSIPRLVRFLVLVDFGPEIDKAGADQVTATIQDAPSTFTSVHAYAEWLSERRPLANLISVQRFAADNLKRLTSGRYTVKMDPSFAAYSAAVPKLVIGSRYHRPELWSALTRITCPTLLVRGLGSAVFPADVAVRMQRTLPNATRDLVYRTRSGTCYHDGQSRRLQRRIH
jgi:pimeloyl-ACP methyl ester carboxylesterase